MTRRKLGGILPAAVVIVVAFGLVAGVFAQEPDATVTSLSPNELAEEGVAAETADDYNAILLKARQFTPEPGGELSALESPAMPLFSLRGNRNRRPLMPSPVKGWTFSNMFRDMRLWPIYRLTQSSTRFLVFAG